MKSKETCSLELVGQINLVTRKGKKTTREELDGMKCLKALWTLIKRGLDHMEAELALTDKPVSKKRR